MLSWLLLVILGRNCLIRSFLVEVAFFITFIIAFGAHATVAFRAPKSDPRAFSLDSSSKDLLAQKIERLSQDRLWMRLLHLAAPGTKVISPSFYFSDTSHHQFHFETELKLNLQQAQADSNYRCLFPAREQWLRQNFPEIDFVARTPCSELDSWRASQFIESFSIVYPSQSAESSLGIFSHTFLKINLAKFPVSSNLNVALGFAADLNPQDSLAKMASMGIFGGYVGKFSLASYYTEVNRYGESESRDIFEYELNLKKSEIEFLMLHIWELRDAEFHYYFLNGNCSYHLLTLLEIARSDLELSSQFHFMTIPLTSLKVVLAQENLIGTRRWIPGKQTRQRQMQEQLSFQGRRLYRELRDSKDRQHLVETFEGSPLSTSEKSIVLELLAEKYRGKKELAEFRADVLRLRSLMPIAKEDGVIPLPQDLPENSHGAEALSVGAGYDHDHSAGWMQLRYRTALHHMMDPPGGYFHNITFELGDIRLRYSKQDQFDNSTFIFINAVILKPWTDDHQHLSWKVRSKIHNFLTASSWENSGGIGVASELGPITINVMAIADTRIDAKEKSGFGIFWGGTAGLTSNITDRIRIGGNIDRLWPSQSHYDGNYWQGEFQAAYSSSAKWSMQIGVTNSWRERSAQLEGIIYY